MFGNDVLNLKLNMTEFKEDVFLGPLSESKGLIINLSPGKGRHYLIIFRKLRISVILLTFVADDQLRGFYAAAIFHGWCEIIHFYCLELTTGSALTDGPSNRFS